MRQFWKTVGVDEPEWDDRILEKMLPHVVNCHLHDNNGIVDQHYNPGRGTVDWKHIVGLLKQAPRLQVIQSEVIPVRVHDSIRDICSKFRELGELAAVPKVAIGLFRKPSKILDRDFWHCRLYGDMLSKNSGRISKL